MVPRRRMTDNMNINVKYRRVDHDNDLITHTDQRVNTNAKSVNGSPITNRKIKTLQPAPSLFLVHLAIISAQVAFGGGSVIGSLGMPETNPVLFALIREGIAGPLLCLIAYCVDRYFHKSLHEMYIINVPTDSPSLYIHTYNRHIPSLKDFKLFLAPGLSLYVNQLTFIIGLKISSGILASSWQPSQGILAVIFGWCFGIEKHVDAYKIFGILIGTAGAMFMIIYGNHESGSSQNTDLWHTFGGSIMFFLNCSATVLYLILGRPAFKKYPSSTITGYSYMVATSLMIVTSLIVASSESILNFLCSDCDGAWEVPTVTIYALLYWILMQSLLSYLLMTWANQYADPSVNLAYTVLQPLTSTVVSVLLLLLSVVPNCDDLSADSDKACLYGPSIADLGAIGICIGLYFVIYSDRKKRKKQEKLLENMEDNQPNIADI